jgi:quercetin dioxygenase-like cupin family protein
MSELAGHEDELVDLAALGASLLAGTAEDHAGGRAAKTVLHGPDLRATVIALRAGHELGEHDAPAAATLLVHAGQVRLCSEDREQAVGPGQLVTIPHERHSLVADTDAVVVLTVRLD